MMRGAREEDRQQIIFLVLETFSHFYLEKSGELVLRLTFRCLFSQTKSIEKFYSEWKHNPIENKMVIKTKPLSPRQQKQEN